MTCPDMSETCPTISLRRYLRKIEQGWSPQCENHIASDDEWGVLKVGCVNGGKFVETENKALPTDLDADRSLEVRKGDVLVSRACFKNRFGLSLSTYA
jgi:type I restriction enzyme S subunit